MRERRSGIQARAGPFDAALQSRASSRTGAAVRFLRPRARTDSSRSPAWRAPASSANFSSAATRNRSSPPKADARTVSERLRFRRDEVSAGFFKALGTPLLRGRFFSAADGPDSPRVAIVNECDGSPPVAGARSGGQEIQARPGIPAGRGLRSSESWATCAARDWRTSRSRRCSSRWRRILPGTRPFWCERRWTTR